MTDVLFLAILVAFFGIAVAFVHGCERIVGPDLEAEIPAMTVADDADQAAA